MSIYEGDKGDCRKFCTTGIDGAMTIWDFKVHVCLVKSVPSFFLSSLLDAMCVLIAVNGVLWSLQLLDLFSDNKLEFYLTIIFKACGLTLMAFVPRLWSPLSKGCVSCEAEHSQLAGHGSPASGLEDLTQISDDTTKSLSKQRH